MSQQKPNGPEIRSLAARVERRAAADGKVTVAGYAAVFGEAADIGGWFTEILARGAFSETLKAADVRAYFDHDRGRVLGRSSAGTLRLAEDAKGLAVEIDLPDTTDGRDAAALIERGDVSGMSFGFRVLREEWDETEKTPKRTILEVALHEVSVVSEPAYDGASIALRSLENLRLDRRAREKREHPAHRRIEARRAEMEQRIRRIR